MFEVIEEMRRRLGDIISLGKISKIDPQGRSLIKIDLGGGLESDWTPLMQISTPLCAVWVAPQMGEQVLLLSPDQESGTGVAIRGIYFKERKEPKAKNGNNAVIEFSDGSEFVYDPEENKLTIKTPGEIQIEAESARINAKKAEVKADEINLGEGNLSGVVTKECFCSFTGNWHPDASSTVKAVK